MKHVFIFSATILVLLSSCQEKTENTKEEVNKSGISAKNKTYSVVQEYNFGTIDKRKVSRQEISIDVINNVEKPLVITKVDVTCGCMKVNYTKEPIKYKKKGIITVSIDTKKQKGIFNKPIFIKSNAENDLEIVRIKGEIE